VAQADPASYVFLTLYPHNLSQLDILPHDRLVIIFRRLCISLLNLHSVQVTHEDIKRSNVLVSKGDIPVLCDLGFSHFSPVDEPHTSSGGTLDYSCPQKVAVRILHGQRPDELISGRDV
jgi:serine/threonine protein kinase